MTFLATWIRPRDAVWQLLRSEALATCAPGDLAGSA